MRLVKIVTTQYSEDDFLIATSLDEKQIGSVIKPLVYDETDNDIIYSHADYIEALRTRYPKAIIIAEWEYEILDFTPNNI